MAPVKTLFVPMNRVIGGAERVLLDMLEGLDRREVAPIAALPASGPLEQALHALDVPTVICPAPWWLPFDSEPKPAFCFRRYWEEAPRFLDPLCRLIESEQIRLVYSAGAPILHGALAAHVTRVPHLQHMQDLLGWPRLAYHLPFGSSRVAYRLAGLFSSLTVCVGRTVREDIGKSVPSVKCRIVPLGFRRSAAPVTPMPLSPIGGDICRVGIVGRVERLKGAHVAPAIVQRVCTNARRAHFYWAGDGPSDLIAHLRAASLIDGEPHLHFVGYVENIADFMAGIDVLLHPARNDTFPRVLIEAALAARPLVATRCGGGQEIVEDGVTGLLAEVDDVEGLSAAVLRLIRNRDERARLGAAARRKAERFDLTSFQAGMQQALLDAFRRGPAVRNPIAARTITGALYAPGRIGPLLRRLRAAIRLRTSERRPRSGIAAPAALGGSPRPEHVPVDDSDRMRL